MRAQRRSRGCAQSFFEIQLDRWLALDPCSLSWRWRCSRPSRRWRSRSRIPASLRPCRSSGRISSFARGIVQRRQFDGVCHVRIGHGIEVSGSLTARSVNLGVGDCCRRCPANHDGERVTPGRDRQSPSAGTLFRGQLRSAPASAGRLDAGSSAAGDARWLGPKTCPGCESARRLRQAGEPPYG